jgi:hypothetical protein
MTFFFCADLRGPLTISNDFILILLCIKIMFGQVCESLLSKTTHIQSPLFFFNYLKPTQA